jgi:hypothetical protein
MDCTQVQLFYRSYSDDSAGQLRAGRYHNGPRSLSKEDLLDEFDIHRIKENRQLTALVSVTNHPLEALHRPLAKYYRGYEDPRHIGILIIRAPGGRKSNGPHYAQSLAQERKYPYPEAFKYEYAFEWEIHQRYLEHRISVKTLIDRGIERITPQAITSFRAMRNALLKEILSSEPYGTGVHHGSKPVSAPQRRAYF